MVNVGRILSAKHGSAAPDRKGVCPIDTSMTPVILLSMKTAISIPNQLFDEAEVFAHERGLSRSDLYAKALHAYLQLHRNEAITEQLNIIYAEESSELETPFVAAQAEVLQRDQW